MKNLLQSVTGNSAKFLPKETLGGHEDFVSLELADLQSEARAMELNTEKGEYAESFEKNEQNDLDPLTPEQEKKCNEVYKKYVESNKWLKLRLGYFEVDSGKIKFINKSKKIPNEDEKNGADTALSKINNEVLGDIPLKKWVKYVNDNIKYAPAEYQNSSEFWAIREQHSPLTWRIKNYVKFPKVILARARQVPIFFMRYLSVIKSDLGSKRAVELFTIAVKNLAENDPKSFVRHYSIVKSELGEIKALKLLKEYKVAENLAENSSYSFMEFYPIFKEELGRGKSLRLLKKYKVAENLAENFSYYFMEFYPIFKEELGRGRSLRLLNKYKIAEDFAENDSDYFMKLYPIFKEDLGPEKALKLLNEFVEHFAKEYPSRIMRYYLIFEDLGSERVLEILDIAAENFAKNDKSLLFSDKVSDQLNDVDGILYAMILRSLDGLSDEELVKISGMPFAKLFINIDNNSLKELKVHPNTSIKDKRRFIARYLYYKKIKLSKENVSLAIKEINDNYLKLKDVPFFKGREVVFTAHNELMSQTSDKHRFGKKDALEEIKAQSLDSRWSFFRAENDSFNEIVQIKEDLKNKILKANNSSTFIFDGHGGVDSFYISNGFLGITSDRIVGWLVDRYELKIATTDEMGLPKKSVDENKLPLEKRPIFIFMGCYQSNFIEDIFNKLKKKGIVPPIMISMSEYGKEAYSDTSSIYGNIMLEKVFDLPNSSYENPTTFEHIYKNQHLGNSNIMTWVPKINKDGEIYPIQIAANSLQEKTSLIEDSIERKI